MRAFLAIPLPETVRRVAAASREGLVAAGDGWRVVRDEGLHVTIRFLGDVDPSRRAACDAAWREAARGVGSLALRLRGAAVVPRTGRPRVLWLGLDDETPDQRLVRLADRMERAARSQGFPPEARPFSAHVTLARARSGARVTKPPVERIGDLGTFVADCVVLYRSEPDRGGSRYYEEASYPLASGSGE
jgi:2'-5' RNA ligase